MVMFVLAVPVALLGLLVAMEPLERWAARPPAAPGERHHPRPHHFLPRMRRSVHDTPDGAGASRD